MAGDSHRPCPSNTPRSAASTVIEHALAPFESDPDCAGIVVAIAADDAWWPAIAARRSRLIEGVAGGEQRAHSVRNALRALPRVCATTTGSWFTMRRGPASRSSDLQLLKRELASHPVGGLLAVPLADTLKRALEPGAQVTHVDATVDRDGLWRAATPQVFRCGVLLRALEAALDAQPHAHRRSAGHRMERPAATTRRRPRG